MTPDEAARRVAAGSLFLRPSLPTGVGHCCYIRRHALDLVGGFDPAFEPGYGEEVDFCQRAIAAGFRHVLADDVFTFHRGRASFGSRPEMDAIRAPPRSARAPTTSVVRAGHQPRRRGSGIAARRCDPRRPARPPRAVASGSTVSSSAPTSSGPRRSSCRRSVPSAAAPRSPASSSSRATRCTTTSHELRDELPAVEFIGVNPFVDVPDRVCGRDVPTVPGQRSRASSTSCVRAGERFVVNQLDSISYRQPGLRRRRRRVAGVPRHDPADDAAGQRRGVPQRAGPRRSRGRGAGAARDAVGRRGLRSGRHLDRRARRPARRALPGPARAGRDGVPALPRRVVPAQEPTLRDPGLGRARASGLDGTARARRPCTAARELAGAGGGAAARPARSPGRPRRARRRLRATEGVALPPCRPRAVPLDRRGLRAHPVRGGPPRRGHARHAAGQPRRDPAPRRHHPRRVRRRRRRRSGVGTAARPGRGAARSSMPSSSAAPTSRGIAPPSGCSACSTRRCAGREVESCRWRAS